MSLLRFYDWEVMGHGARASSRRKRLIEMIITPSYSMVKNSFCTVSHISVWGICSPYSRVQALLLHVSPMAAPAVVDAARKAQAEKEKKKGS